jgi:hypothetical protein
MSEWMSRVDQATSGAIHEQLRTVVSEAREVLDKFTTLSWEQGGLLLDAQREMEAAITKRIAQVSEEVSASIVALREEIMKRMDAMAAEITSMQAHRSQAPVLTAG